MIEAPVLDAIDSFSLEELTLHLKKTFIKVFPSAYLIYEPKILLILYRIIQLRDMLCALATLCSLYQPSDLQLYDSRCITLTANFRELLHCKVLPLSRPSFDPLPKPNDCNSTLSQYAHLFVPLRASIAELLFFCVTHENFLPRQPLGCGGGMLGRVDK